MAGTMESGHKSGGWHLPDYTWAKRTANWYEVDGRSDVLLNISRSPDSLRGGDSASIAIFFGDENDTSKGGCQLTETELREMLVAIGCEWAEESGAKQTTYCSDCGNVWPYLEGK